MQGDTKYGRLCGVVAYTPADATVLQSLLHSTFSTQDRGILWKKEQRIINPVIYHGDMLQQNMYETVR